MAVDGLRDEPFTPEVRSSEHVYSGAVWNVLDDRVRYNDGEIRRQYVQHPGAAAVVALDDAGRVLLIQQYRHPIRHRDWEVPAGLLDVPAPVRTASCSRTVRPRCRTRAPGSSRTATAGRSGT